MIRTLIARWQARGAATPAPPDPADLLYVVGDVHGRTDLLLALLERIADDAAGRATPARLVFLGDYVDRGPDTAGTLEVLADLPGACELAPVFLMGNHERMLLDFLADPAAGPRWLRAGGDATLASFALSPPGDTDEPEAWAVLRDGLAGALALRRGFLAGLRAQYLSGNVLCSHAGGDPALAPEAQGEAALLWGRAPEPGRARADGLWSVSGHVIVPEPEMRPGRICIDTGAWFTDRLTAARIAAGEVAFLST